MTRCTSSPNVGRSSGRVRFAARISSLRNVFVVGSSTRCIYAEAIYEDEDATLDDVREAVTTLEDTERIARRVLGGAHPITTGIEGELRASRAALCARETLSRGAGKILRLS